MSLADLAEQLERLTDEALDLRFSDAGDPGGKVFLPESGTPLDGVVDSLLRVRRRLDRTEEILTEVIRIRGRIRRMFEVANDTVQDKWDEVVTTDPRINSGSFVPPREKYAQANLATMTLRRQLATARDMVSRADESMEITRSCHRGLDTLRYDHVVMIRAATVMTSLEG